MPSIIWTFHMPLFFFLSGLTAKSWSPGSIVKFSIGLKSLLIPYLFFSLISIAFWMTTQKSMTSGHVWFSELGEMAYGVAGHEKTMAYNVPLWFFTCLLSVRILFAALTSVTRSKPLQCACAVSLAIVAHVWLFPQLDSVVWNADLAMVALVFFIAGFAVQKTNIASLPSTRLVRWTLVLSTPLIFACCVIINGRVDMNERVFGNPAVFYLGALAGIAILVQVATRVSQFTAIQTMGRASIVIFSVHALFWLLPPRLHSLVDWYVLKIVRFDILVPEMVTMIEIGACMMVYFAIVRWAPFLIGLSNKGKAYSKPVSAHV